MQDGSNNWLNSFENDIFSVKPFDFESKALELFQFQYTNNEVYRKYCTLIHCDPNRVTKLQGIPFLPINAFKTHAVVSGEFKHESIFTSSGTSGQLTSKHYIKENAIYEKSFVKGFELFYNSIEDYCVLGLLPSYLERSGSSLIYMVDHFIHHSRHEQSGFFLNDQQKLAELLIQLSKKQEKTLLIGVSFALLDFVENHNIPFNKNLIVMETGGMKGRRKELIRSDLHDQLKKGFHCSTIHSEYGMTELLSQAYSNGKGLFKTPPWMKVLIRKQDDPFAYCSLQETGGLNIIDLANIHSCAFIQTDDLAKQHDKHQFEVLGRFDATDVRGCNLMVV